MKGGVSCCGSPIESLISLESRRWRHAGKQLAQLFKGVGLEQGEVGIHWKAHRRESEPALYEGDASIVISGKFRSLNLGGGAAWDR
jgi:hypothetical protein